MPTYNDIISTVLPAITIDSNAIVAISTSEY